MTLDRWLRQKKMSEQAFAALVDHTCTQSLVSKWRRGVVMPSIDRAYQIQSLTSGAVTVRGLERNYRRAKAELTKRAGWKLAGALGDAL